MIRYSCSWSTCESIVVCWFYDLLESHFNRLSPFEQEILYWMVIEREPVALDSLREDLSRQLTKREMLEALESLRERYMIEVISRGSPSFTLQPVIMEYVTDKFVEQ